MIAYIEELYLHQISENLPDLSDSVYKALKDLVISLKDSNSEQNKTVLSILSAISEGKLLVPLTGEEDEWVKSNCGNYFVNKRHPLVYKDNHGNAWYSRGKIFYENYQDKETGLSTKVCFLTERSKVLLTFPCIPTSLYIEVEPGNHVFGDKITV